jgi:hypothetical protein
MSSDLRRFIDKFCHNDIHMAVAEYVEAHYDTLNLQSDVIKYLESAELESLSLKTTRNVRINRYFVEFNAIMMRNSLKSEEPFRLMMPLMNILRNIRKADRRR